MTQGSCFFLAVGMPREKFSRTTLPIIRGPDASECIGASIDFLPENSGARRFGFRRLVWNGSIVLYPIRNGLLDVI